MQQPHHSMVRANLNKSKKSLDFYYHSIKVHTYPRVPESVSIEIPPFRPHFITFSKTVNLVSQCLHYFVTLGLKGGISIDADSGPLGIYTLMLW